VTGTCGTADASAQFFICDYIAFMKPSSPTICPGGSVMLHLEAGGTTAGSPFGGYDFYRCPELPPATCTAASTVLLQSGSTNAYTATMPGTYFGVMRDRLGCPSRYGTGGWALREASCP